MGEMRILSTEGDTKVIWDSENDDECDAAEAQFNSLKKKGYQAFEVGKRGKKTDERVDEWDPDLGKLIMVPGMRGG
jgi:hypothetical protein